MIYKTALALLPPLIEGFLLLSILWPGRFFTGLPWKLVLAPGAGFGLTSFLYFIWMILFPSQQSGFWLVDISVSLGLVFATFYFSRRSANKENDIGSGELAFLPGKLDSVLIMIAAIAVIAFFVNYLVTSYTTPNGSFDAYAIWNLRARFLYRGSQFWQNAFSSSINWIFHADYPLLLPLNVLRIWTLTGREVFYAPSLIGAIFAFGTLGLAWMSAGWRLGHSAGSLASILILAVPFFLDISVWQLADQPLAYYILAVGALIYLYFTTGRKHPQLLALTGLYVGLAAWIKNEGLIFLIAVIAGLILNAILWKTKPGIIHVIRFGLGGVIPLLVIVFFKFAIVPSNDVLESQSISTMLFKIIDFNRWQAILGLLGRELVRFGRAPFPVLFVPLCYLILSRVRLLIREEKPGITAIVIILAFQYMGYFFVYLVTPHPLQWHVTHSADRLLMQGYPLAALVCILAGRLPNKRDPGYWRQWYNQSMGIGKTLR